MNQQFDISIEISGDHAELYTMFDGTKEVIVPVMATAFQRAIEAGDKPTIEAFEIIQSVCLSVIDAMPGLQAKVSNKTFRGKDHFHK